MRWENMGQKPEVQASAERTLIVAVLAKAGRPMAVTEIAEGVPSMKQVNVKNLLALMHKTGDLETVARHVGTASGALGSCMEYLSHTLSALKAQGLEDRMLRAVRKLCEPPPA